MSIQNNLVRLSKSEGQINLRKLYGASSKTQLMARDVQTS